MKYLGSAILALSLFAFTSAASAAVVCNDAGDCWKVKKRFNYPAEANVQIYDDDWTWPDSEAANYRWREPGVGRGYWRRGVWIGF